MAYDAETQPSSVSGIFIRSDDPQCGAKVRGILTALAGGPDAQAARHRAIARQERIETRFRELVAERFVGVLVGPGDTIALRVQAQLEAGL